MTVIAVLLHTCTRISRCLLGTGLTAVWAGFLLSSVTGSPHLLVIRPVKARVKPLPWISRRGWWARWAIPS